jgi:cytochrome c biogenesis protein CcmG, thiol:disulfide interchange protein DsbE
VINVWASWCTACRAEFPLFASASARYGRRVAFLGVDTNDNASDGRSFFAQHPVSYPSYQSSSTQLTALAAIEGMPTTIFLNRAGKVAHVHIGQYETQAALVNEIEHYALGVAG